jgi:hypothetical protein
MTNKVKVYDLRKLLRLTANVSQQMIRFLVATDPQ